MHLCIRKRDETHQYPTERLNQIQEKNKANIQEKNKANIQEKDKANIQEKNKANIQQKNEPESKRRNKRLFKDELKDYSQQNWNHQRKHDPTHSIQKPDDTSEMCMLIES